jgi:hypothetical protein
MTEKVMKNSSDIMKLQLKLENLEGVIEGIEKRLSRRT